MKTFVLGKRKLSFAEKCLIIGLIVIGFLFTFQKETFQYYQTKGFENTEVGYLPSGDYAAFVIYDNAVPGNEICVVSDRGINRELVRENIGTGYGELNLRFHVEQGEYNVRFETVADENASLRLIDLQSVRLINRDGLFLSMLCILVALCLFWVCKYQEPGKYKVPFALIGIGLLCSIPFFSEYLIKIHLQDLQFHLTRIEGIYQGLRAGEFPVRINGIQTDGYGNLSATMYPQLFLYLPAVLRLLGVSLMTVYKTLVVCMNIATALIAYYSVQGITKSHQMGMVATLLYTFAPYRLSNVYFRAAVGESLAMVFLPLVIWGMYEILWGNRKKWYLLFLGMTGLLQSHVLSVEMCAIFLLIEFIWWLLKKGVLEKGKRVLSLVLAAGVTILANATMLFPFLYFMSQDLQAYHMPNRVSDSVLYLSQIFTLFAKPEGYSMEPGSVSGEMPLSVGLLMLFGVIAFVLYESMVRAAWTEDKVNGHQEEHITVSQKEESTAENGALSAGTHCMVYGLAAVLLSTAIVPWAKLEEYSFLKTFTTSLQFTWRFLSVACALLTVVSAVGIVGLVKKTGKQWIYGVVVTLTVISMAFFFDTLSHEADQVSNKLQLEGQEESDSIYMYSESEEFQDIRMRYNRDEAWLLAEYSVITECESYTKRGSGIEAVIEMEDATELQFPIYYFPGYRVKINGKEVENYAKDALLACIVPSGNVSVSVKYVGLPLFWVGDIVTLLTVLGLIAVCCKKQFDKKK